MNCRSNIRLQSKRLSHKKTAEGRRSHHKILERSICAWISKSSDVLKASDMAGNTSRRIHDFQDTKFEQDSMKRIHFLTKSAAAKGCRDNGASAQQAEKILLTLEKRQLKPTAQMYIAVMKCWAKSMHRDAGARAESWLDKMQALHSSGLKLDNIAYNTVIHAYANIGKGADAERILNRHICAYRRGFVDSPPDIVSYSSTIHGYAKCRKPEDAERILQQVEDLELSGETSLKPGIYCYSAVINAYAKSRGGKKEYKRVMRILEKMEQAGISNTVTYTSVITFLGRINEPWAEKKAIGMLNDMWDMHQEGNMSVKPNRGEVLK